MKKQNAILLVLQFFIMWLIILLLSFQIDGIKKDLKRVVSTTVTKDALKRSKRHIPDVQIKNWMSDTNKTTKRLRGQIEAIKSHIGNVGSNCQCIDEVFKAR